MCLRLHAVVLCLQVELLDVAIKKNTIVCLGSDFGKTFLAVMLMKELSPLVRQCLKSGGKRSVYLVSSGECPGEFQAIFLCS